MDRAAAELDNRPGDGEATELHHPLSSTLNHQLQTPASQSKLSRFWGRHVSLEVLQKTSRDHLANERTYLAYLRTAQAVAILGVAASQLFRLTNPAEPGERVGFYSASVPFAAACHVVAFIICLLGMWRFLRHQEQMYRGFAVAGGWEMLTVYILGFSVG